MDQKRADEEHWPLMVDQHPNDEERLLHKFGEQPEPQPSHRSNARRNMAFAVKCLAIVGLVVYLLGGVGRDIMDKHFDPNPEFDTFGHELDLLSYPHEFDDPRVTCEVVNITDSNSLLKALNFNLTTKADKIKVFARGPIVGNVTLDSGDTAGDDIEVDVKFHHLPKDDSAFNPGYRVGPLHQIDSPKPLIVKVCPFTAPGGGYNAVGIFAFHDCHHKHSARDGPGGPPPPPPRRPHPPHGPPPRSPVEATIAIRFPKSSSADRLEIHDFSTELAGFHHHVPTLDIAFTKLTLVGSVEAAGIGATELAVVNIFGGIKGNFSASKELLLTSSSGPIEADVELWYGESEEGAAEPTKLSIIADRSYIRTNVSLLTYSSDTTPWYTVKTVASSDFARLNFTSQPLGSALGIETFSKDHPTNLYLHPAFEGQYEVNSVFQNPIVVIPEDTKDPYGEGRKRVVKEDKTWTPWVKKGSIEWVKESDKDEEGKNNPLGHIKMTTLKAPAELVLG